jgi:hypothetical protein
MAQEWNIRHRGHECSICGCQFEDRQKCVSLLREADQSYERMDCCTGCWDKLERDWEPFSLWDGIYRAPKPAELKEEPVKKDTAESLLRKLIALEDPAMLNVVYVLAVMLERGKQLVERDTKPHESGGILRIYECRKSGDTFVVLDPRLRLDKLAIVQQQVVALLSGTHTLGSQRSEESSAPSASSRQEECGDSAEVESLDAPAVSTESTPAPSSS